ncbi:MAG: hypothetical protein HDT28_01600 [Clostridiales bacterium]|nr:hypothetical protein [Clostridiales bacterium]
MDLYSTYPKQFRQNKLNVEKNRCFVLMPFNERYNKLYGAIKSELSRLKIICNRDDEINGSQPFMNKVLTEIVKSRYLIVILTDYRPNVLYELGIAHCFKDVKNVLLLIERNSQISQPINKNLSDISHLTYYEYDIDNLIQVKSYVEDFISANKCSSDFYDFLTRKEILNNINENSSDFVSYVEEKFSEYFQPLCELLAESPEYILKDNETTINIILDKCVEVLFEILKQNSDYILAMIKTYAELMITTKKINGHEKRILNILNKDFTDLETKSEAFENKIKIEFALYFASRGEYLDIILPWIINYFMKTKTANIDLNRYQLEAFLMTCQHFEVNNMICNAVFDKNCYIREHMADIIGDKRLYAGVENIRKQLATEENYYSAVSEIEALGKLDAKDSVDDIIDWVDKHKSSIIAEKQFFVLKHVRIALEKLDTGKTVVKSFDKNYNKYLQNYFIL